MRLPIKIPKNQPLGFWIHPEPCWVREQPGVSQGHLEVPWEYQIGPKLKIYVKIMYSEHFLVFEIFWLLVIFETLFSEKCSFVVNFDKNLLENWVFVKIAQKGTFQSPKTILDPSCSVLGTGTARGESDPSGSPLGVPNWSEIENLCENHVFCAFSVF